MNNKTPLILVIHKDEQMGCLKVSSKAEFADASAKYGNHITAVADMDGNIIDINEDARRVDETKLQKTITNFLKPFGTSVE